MGIFKDIYWGVAVMNIKATLKEVTYVLNSNDLSGCDDELGRDYLNKIRTFQDAASKLVAEYPCLKFKEVNLRVKKIKLMANEYKQLSSKVSKEYERQAQYYKQKQAMHAANANDIGDIRKRLHQFSRDLEKYRKQKSSPIMMKTELEDFKLYLKREQEAIVKATAKYGAELVFDDEGWLK